jgi:hypothetical protein
MRDHADDASWDASQARHLAPVRERAKAFTDQVERRFPGSTHLDGTRASVVKGQFSVLVRQRDLPQLPKSVDVLVRPGVDADVAANMLSSINDAVDAHLAGSYDPDQIKWHVALTDETVPQHHATRAAVKHFESNGYKEVGSYTANRSTPDLPRDSRVIVFSRAAD